MSIVDLTTISLADVAGAANMADDDHLAVVIEASRAAGAADAPHGDGPWYYAQLGADGRCVAVTQTSGPIDSGDVLRVASLDISLIGRSHDGERWLPEPAAPEAPRRITRLAFLQRFHDAEAIAIDLASIGATVEAAGVRRYLSLVNAANYIDLGRPDTRAGVIALEQARLIGPGRALEILDAPLSPAELPGGAQ